MPGSRISYKQIADKLALELGITKKKARNIIEVFFSTHIGRRVQTHEETILRGFGSFKLNRRGKQFLKRKKAATRRAERQRERNFYHKKKGKL